MHDETEHWNKEYEWQPSTVMPDTDMAEMLAIFRYIDDKWIVLPRHDDYDMDSRDSAIAYIGYMKGAHGGRYRLVKVSLSVEGEW